MMSLNELFQYVEVKYLNVWLTQIFTLYGTNLLIYLKDDISIIFNDISYIYDKCQKGLVLRASYFTIFADYIMKIFK